MKSIKLILCVVLLLAGQFYAQDNWTQQNNGISTTINSITFFNADTGIVVGAGGTIYRTINGGKNWTLIEGDTGTTSTEFSPNDILVENFNSSRSNVSSEVDTSGMGPATAIIVGGGGGIKRSMDLGLSWITISSNTSLNINGITNDGTNYSAEIIYAVGDSGLILKSSDDGLTWTQQVSGTNVKLNSVTFFNADTGIAVGNNGTILRTTDGGGLWKAISGGTANIPFTPNDILAENYNSSRSNVSSEVDTSGSGPAIAIIVGSGGSILRSTNFGLNWSPVSSGTSSSLLGLAFKDSSLTAVGANGTVVVSSDFGMSWQKETSRTNSQLRAVEIAIKEEGVNRYMGGNGGAFFKAAPSQLSIISPNPGDIWYTGTSHTINWSGGNPGWNVLISLGDVNTWTVYTTLNSNTLNDGSDVWNIPSTIPAGEYQIYIQEVNQLDWRYSGTFTIESQNVTNSWFPLGTGMNGWVLALAKIGNELYAGGTFTTAGGVSANYIAKWGRTGWSALGNGMDGQVLALAVIGTTLYAGGEFTTAGGVSASGIAKWDGTSWSALGSGVGGTLPFSFPVVHSLGVLGTSLYAGGQFTTAGGVSASRIAKWDGTSWSALGSGMDGPNPNVMDITVIGNDLYAAGLFNTANGVTVNNIAKWDGTSWSALGSGVNDWVLALTVLDDELYAGGGFTTAGGVSAKTIAKWNGTNWSTLGNGTDGPNALIRTLTVTDSDLYAGGEFTIAGNNNANFIAKWDGTNWAPFASEVNNPVHTFTFIENSLYVGGVFIYAGGSIVNHIARSQIQTITDIEDSKSPPEVFELMQSYPNPFNPTTTIRFNIAESGFTTLKIYDILGRVVTTLVNEVLAPGIYERTFDAKGLASGVYFYRMQTGKLVQTKKMLLLK